MPGRVAVRFGDKYVLTPGHRDAKADFEQIAAPMPRLWHDDRHMATRDTIGEFFQPLRLFFDFRPDCIRGFEVLKSNFERSLPVMLPCRGSSLEAPHLKSLAGQVKLREAFLEIVGNQRGADQILRS